MISRSITKALGVCLIAVCTSASAADSTDKQSGWYVGAGAGTGYKLYGGYQFNKNWAAEMDFVHFGKFDFTSPDSRTKGTVNGVGLSAIGMLPLSENFRLLGKVGALAKSMDVEEHDPSSRYYYAAKTTEIAPYWGFGAEYRMSPSLSLRTEYEHHGQSDVGNRGKKITNHLLTVGLRYHF